MPLGTDAVAGAHGQNAREIVARVEAGQPARDALISATSLAAESLGLGSTIGTLAPGFEADIIAVSGNPLEAITKTRDVTFVMKGGKVFKVN
jgi:imidazolonepropionase-like amidohydrolase